MGTPHDCINCGAQLALHQYKTEKCPLNGKEETRVGFMQRCGSTRYCHAETARKPHRQICSVCDEQCTVDFWVPDDVWALALHHSRINDLHCLRCFTRAADARFVDYSAMQITAVYPLVRQIELIVK